MPSGWQSVRQAAAWEGGMACGEAAWGVVACGVAAWGVLPGEWLTVEWLWLPGMSSKWPGKAWETPHGGWRLTKHDKGEAA